MNDGRITTPYLMFNNAHSYCAAAKALEDIETSARFPETPVQWLYSHAVELYLKSYLLARGVTQNELRNFSHRFRKTADKAKSLGLLLSNQEEHLIDHLTEIDAIVELRYLSKGMTQRMPVEGYWLSCQYLHKTIGPVAYETSPCKIARIFPNWPEI